MPSQLECRISIIHLKNGKIRLGMVDPLNMRYEPLGEHGPDKREIDKVIENLKTSIIRAGHLLTFSEKSE